MTSSKKEFGGKVVKTFLAEGAVLEELTMMPHRPMGCTVEESLAGGRHVFVAKLTEGGNADMAGLLLGDVIVGLTGIFGDLEDVSGLGLDKIKSLVSACHDEEPLELVIARGTSVLEDHETALVELCANPDSTDEEMEQCVVEFISGGYFSDEDAVQEEELCDAQDSAECLVDSLQNMWAEGLPVREATTELEDDTLVDSAEEKAKPWSTRSSPSGTWVRDPVTREMKNLDS
jgi:hypothetical protein